VTPVLSPRVESLMHEEQEGPKARIVFAKALRLPGRNLLGLAVELCSEAHAVM